jgi:cation diffusion facilitator CzcD-associated flavoprotein CzcO
VADSDGQRLIETWLTNFNAALKVRNVNAAVDCFHADHGWWRDLSAVTWDFRTWHTRDPLRAAITDYAFPAALSSFRLDPGSVEAYPGAWVQALVRFRVAKGNGRGVVRLAADASGTWRALTLMTSLDALTDVPWRLPRLSDLAEPPAWISTAESGERGPVQTSLQTPLPVVIVGAGHNGLFLAAHLRALGVNFLVLEKERRVGDHWRHRYPGLTLHEGRWSLQFPYLDFPEIWPAVLNKWHIADWLETYARSLVIPVETGSNLISARLPGDDLAWELTVRDDEGERSVTARHLVMAIGQFSTPQSVTFPGLPLFEGVVRHSADYRTEEIVTGTRVLVVGAGSTALDVAHDAHERGAKVVLLQRGPTHVLSQKNGIPLYHGSLYSESGPPVDVADLLAHSVPLRFALQLSPFTTRQLAEADAELLSGLERAGFRTTLGPGDMGLPWMTYERAGGYYIDRGTARLISEGLIRVVNGEISDMDSDVVRLTDGTRLAADVIILCSGFATMRHSLRDLLEDDVVDRIGEVWGLDEEGEPRTAFRASGQERLWLTASGFREGRFFSRHLALRIAALEHERENG